MIRQTVLVWILLVGSPGDVTELKPLEASQVGQVWRYHTRANESQSRVLVQRVESDAKLGELVHIRVTDVHLKGPKGPITVMPHVPITSTALRGSVTELESRGNPVPSDYLEGYALWKEAAASGKGGAFTLPVADVIDAVQESFEGH